MLSTLLGQMPYIRAPQYRDLDNKIVPGMFNVDMSKIHGILLARTIANEMIVRKLLERWVSELEPCIFEDSYGHILGMGVHGSHQISLRP